MDTDPAEGQDGLMPDCRDIKLNTNVECRVTLNGMKMKNLSSEFQFHGSTESESTRNLGDEMCLDPDTRVHHIDLDLSDMFLINKTIKVEPGDVDVNSDDPLGLCDLKDAAPGSGIEPGICQPSNLILDNSHDVTMIKIYKCDVCLKGFTKSSNLTRHKLTHTEKKPHSCDICGKDFGRKFELTRHKLIHTGEKSHVCDICGESFVRNYELTGHKVTHTGVKPYRCDICGTSFIRNRELIRHKVTHTGIKPHRCDVCGADFIRNCELTRHKMTHTGEKPHRCDVCGICFTRNCNLTLHKITHTGHESHRCDMCGLEFSRSDDLTRHKVTHTVKSDTDLTDVDNVLLLIP